MAQRDILEVISKFFHKNLFETSSKRSMFLLQINVVYFAHFWQNVEVGIITSLGGLDLSRRDLDRDLDLDAKKVSISTVEKISTVSKS